MVARAARRPGRGSPAGRAQDRDARRGRRSSAWWPRRSARTAGRRWWWTRSWSRPPGTACSRRGRGRRARRACSRSPPWSRPNLDEAAILTGRAVHDVPSMERAGADAARFGAAAALVKGGHLAGAEVDGRARHLRRRCGTSRARASTPLRPTAPAAPSRPRSPPGSRWARPLEHRGGRTRSTTSTAPSPRAPGLGSGHGPLDHTRPGPCHPERRDEPLDQLLQISRDPLRDSITSAWSSRSSGDAGGGVGDRREGEAAHARAPAPRSPRWRWTCRPRRRPAAPAIRISAGVS